MRISRRQVLAGMAAAPALAGGERYRLGVMASLYAAVPLDEAMGRIRKAGYRYAAIAAKHAGQTIYATDLSKPERAAMLRRIRDLGVEPFLSLGGFSAELQSEGGVEKYLAQLDLCADYEIPVMVGAGPWYYTQFPNLPKRQRDWEPEVNRFYTGLEKAVRHAEFMHVTIALKPHTGITARARDCMAVLRRIVSPNLKITWDAGNVSFYEGIHPDPDLPDLAPQVAGLCIKDHLGLRGEANFPIPGQGNVNHEEMFRTLFAAGFHGPMAIERVDGRDGRLPPNVVDERLKAAHEYLAPLLDRVTSAS